ncbi:hypothetical protein [Brucella anthropi]|uniref:hypothetical protein n=1 Tax=Brucella anthropi TaxID=529 RepID=UPI0005B968D2|nr:hypothetical protein [Brucella anthropi]KIU68407.1 hypothetical protein TR92_11075 [Brucella anthropi]
MPRCDICNEHSAYVNEVREIYRTDDIRDICSDCEKIVNKQLRKIQTAHGSAQQSLLKRFMRVLKRGGDRD